MSQSRSYQATASRSIMAFIVAVAMSFPSHASVTSNVYVVRDPPDAVVDPGETVPIMIRVTWNRPGYQFAGLRGDTLFTDDQGSSEVPWSYYWNPIGQPAYVVLGTPRGGSIINTDIAVIPGFFTASPQFPSLAYLAMPLIVFDWTAPLVSTPTVVDIRFSAPPIAPSARFYPSSGSPAWVEAETFYHGTSIMVMPGPSGLALLVAGGVVASRRRRV